MGVMMTIFNHSAYCLSLCLTDAEIGSQKYILVQAMDVFDWAFRVSQFLA